MKRNKENYEIIERDGERFVFMNLGEYLANGLLLEPYQLQSRDYIPSIRKVASQVLEWVWHLADDEFSPFAGRNHSGHYESYRETVMRFPKGFRRRKTRLVKIAKLSVPEDKGLGDDRRKILSARKAIYEHVVFLGENGVLYYLEARWLNENPNGHLVLKEATDALLSKLSVGALNTVYKGLLGVMGRALYAHEEPAERISKAQTAISRIRRRLWPS